MTQNHWDRRMLGLAKYVSEWSKDPSTKVGSVICDPLYRVVSIGFNGLPRGVTDTLERLSNREVKYKMIVHAERNAMLFAKGDLRGCYLYVTPFMPCAACAAMIAQVGITRVFSVQADYERWSDDCKLAKAIFDETGIELIIIPDQT